MASAALASGAQPTLVQTSEFVWSENDSWFGGLSGAEISADGTSLIAISDRGRVIEAAIERTNGKVTNVALTHSVALRDSAGKILVKPFTDAEGLAIAPDGQVFASFEGQHRVVSLSVEDGTTTPLPQQPDFSFLAENSGMEALATLADGTLIAIPEKSSSDKFPVYAYTDGGWRVLFNLPSRGPFLPVGADFDDAGNLYLLERTVTPLGFRTRIRRFNMDGETLVEETLLQTLPARYDNLEAISVWTNDQGQTSITLIADDNFFPIQKTQIVEFTLTE